MILCHSSGSTCSARSIDPFTSAKSAVTCLRSPSSALRDVRIFSARCLGVYERGSGGGPGFVASESGPPHLPQNLIAGAFPKPQLEHLRFSGAPQSPQNFMPLAFSKAQAGQRIDGLEPSAR